MRHNENYGADDELGWEGVRRIDDCIDEVSFGPDSGGEDEGGERRWSR